MAHILTRPSDPVAAVRQFSAPNLVVFTRGKRHPVPVLEMDMLEEKAAESEGPEVSGTKREIRGKSRQSANNCARVLSSLDWAKHGECVHATFGYWQSYPSSKQELAREKQAIVQSLARHVECGLWSLEYQTERFKKYGVWVPHWHVLVWMAGRSVEEFEAWARVWWASLSGNPSEYGVKVTSGTQARGTWYLALHAAKRAQAPPFAVGRWWGYVNRERLLGAQDIGQTAQPDVREFVWWCRLYRRHTGGKTRFRDRVPQGFSWFLPRSAQTRAGAFVRDIVQEERRRAQKRNPF